MYVINSEVNKDLESTNSYLNQEYKKICKIGDAYQDKIPSNCDGIWINPKNSMDGLFKTSFNGLDGTTSLRNLIKSDPSKIKEFLKNSTSLFDIYEKQIFIDMNFIRNLVLFNGMNINNEIIFVFSDIMYLGMYMNENLNHVDYNQKLKTKIEQLSNYKINGETLSHYTKLYDTFKLKRNLDGFLDDSGNIRQDSIKKQDYYFIVKDTCGNKIMTMDPTSPFTRDTGSQASPQSASSVTFANRSSTTSLQI
jgi:hypothetical protein